MIYVKVEILNKHNTPPSSHTLTYHVTQTLYTRSVHVNTCFY